MDIDQKLQRLLRLGNLVTKVHDESVEVYLANLNIVGFCGKFRGNGSNFVEALNKYYDSLLQKEVVLTEKDNEHTFMFKG